MADSKPKSLAPLMILRILEEFTDSDHPIKQSQIAEILEDRGLEIERKALSRHIEKLMEMDGVTIKTAKERKGLKDPVGSKLYLDERLFTDTQLRLIIDCLSANRFLSADETTELIDQVASLSSKHFRKKIGHYRFMNNRGKTENTSLLYNLESIDEAMTKHNKIRFDLLGTNKKGEKVVVFENQNTTPIQVLVKGQEYYLLCFELCNTVKEGYILYSYPLDMLTNVEMLEQKADSITTIPEFQNGIDYDKLLREHPALDNFRGKPELCTFHCYPNMLDSLKAHFGSEVRVMQLKKPASMEHCENHHTKAFDRMMEVSVLTDPYAALEYAWKNPEGIWLVGPEKATTVLKRRLRAQKDYYEFLELKY